MNPRKPGHANPIATAAAQVAIQPAIDAQLNREQRRAMGIKGKKSGITVAEAAVASGQITIPEDNKVWDEVQQHSLQCHRLLSTPGSIVKVLKAPEIKEIIAEQGKDQLRDKTSEVLARDIVEFQTFFTGIREHHKDRTGASNGPNDHFRAIQISNDYVQFTEQFNANVMPMIETLGEIAQSAEAVLEERNPEAANRIRGEVKDYLKGRGIVVEVREAPALTPEQDPNVVTDAVVV